MTVLDAIFSDTRAAVESRMAAYPLSELEAKAESVGSPPDFLGALRSPPHAPPAIIAEVKRRSPSRGILTGRVEPLSLALQYAEGGAAAVSVLTEERHFGGSLNDLFAVTSGLAAEGKSLPALRKDFIYTRYQLLEAKAAGAGAALLIVAMLSTELLETLLADAQALELDALVEVHTRAELDIALSSGARLIGINNRDLRTLTVDLATFFDLIPLVPPGITVVSESGIKTPGDLKRLGAAGAAAVLIGETLMTAPDPAEMLRTLRGAP